MSNLAKDFFNRVCHLKPNHRYNASTALKHPWITRKEGKIPLNFIDEMDLNLRLCETLRETQRLMLVMAVIKKKTKGLASTMNTTMDES